MPKKTKRKKANRGLRWEATVAVKPLPYEIMSFLVREHLKERNQTSLGRQTLITEAYYKGLHVVVTSGKELPIPRIMTIDEFIEMFPEEIGKSIFDVDSMDSTLS